MMGKGENEQNWVKLTLYHFEKLQSFSSSRGGSGCCFSLLYG
jgi:hypothetical protein